MPTGKGPLRIAIEDFLEGFKFSERIKNAIVQQVKELHASGLSSSWSEILNSLGAGEGLPAIVSNRSPAAVLGLPALIPMLLGALIGLGFSFISVLIQPVALLAQYQVNKKWAAFRIDPRSLAQLLKLWPEKSNDWLGQLTDLGVNEVTLNGLQALNRQYLTAFQYVALWRRDAMGEGALNERLRQLGFLDSDITALKQVTEIIPSITDLITLQVKEAFNDQASQRFNHDEGDKSQVTAWAEKQGLSADWVNRYWRAHWQLPSPQQVFEMLQRLRPGKSNNPVTGEDVRTFLQMADYSPFWRERLTEIAYAPFTRVDVRRMYKTGVLNETQVKEAYLDLGYNAEKAQALTEFTIAYEAEEETGIVRSSVISAYGDGFIPRDEAESMLKAGGYDDTTIAFYLDNVDFKESLKVQQIKLNTIHKRYLEGIIDETSVNNEINQLNLPSERVTALLELWTTERESQVTLPTQAQVEKFVELGIATIDDYKRISLLRGYDVESIEWNIQRIEIERQAQATKEAEKAAADMERALKDKDASQYQIDKADIELAIAQAKAQITDIDIALHGELDESQVLELNTQKDELKRFIAEMNVAKAQLKYDYQSDRERLGSDNG
jgi:NACalpha-BTF3-like transcription factor